MRRLAVVLSLIVLAVPVAAVSAGNPVVAAAEKSARARSSAVQFAAVTNTPGVGRTTLSGSGKVLGSAVRLTLNAVVLGQRVRMDAVALRESGHYVFYLRSPLLAAQLPAGKTWLRVDLDKTGAGLGLDVSSVLGASQSTATLARGIVSTSRIGSETVAGRPTTHYRAIVDYAEAAQADPKLRDQIAALERLTGARLTRVPQDVWVGIDGRIRRYRSAMTVVQNGVQTRAVQTLTFLAYDVPVTISAPPRTQVFELPS